MPSSGQTTVVKFFVLDTSTNLGKTGDAANLTLKWDKDGVASTPTNVPATEVDATNAPGLYKITMTAAECTCVLGTIGGKSSTAGILVIPKDVSFENLPTAAPAAAGGVPTLGTGTGQLNPTGGAVPITGAVTVGTNNDKTGYTLTGVQTGVTIPTVTTVTNAVALASNIKKNQALSGFPFYLALSSDHQSPATGKTVTATRELDGGGFFACANSVTETAGGWYKIDLAAGDLNGNTVALSFSATACDTTQITIITQP